MLLSDLEMQLALWHDTKYGTGSIDIPKTVSKLGEEFGEFLEAVMRGDNPQHIAEEAVDNLFVMAHIVRHFAGIGALNCAAVYKLGEINRRLVRGKLPKS